MNTYNKVLINFFEELIEITEVLLTQSRVRAYFVSNFLNETLNIKNTLARS